MSYVFYKSNKTDGSFCSICSNSDGTQLAATDTNGNIWVSYNYGMSYILKRNLGFTGIKKSSICSNSSGSVLAVCVNTGNIYVSINYGNTWTLYASIQAWTSICSNSSGNRLAACVNGNYIYISANYGGTWEAKATSLAWTSICCDSKGIIYAACVNNDYIYISTWYGNAWTPIADVKLWKSICCDSTCTKFFAACSNEVGIRISTDSGNSWPTLSGSPSRNYNFVCCNSSGSKFATLTDLGELYINTGSGLSLNSLPSGISNLTSICMGSSDDRILACVNGSNGIIYGYKPLQNFYYKNTYIENICFNASLTDASNNILTNYRTNGSSIKFLKPFYTDTSNSVTFDNDTRMYVSIPYYIDGILQKFCPPYYLYPGTANFAASYVNGTNATYTGIPPSGATEMLVILVGGGGGGGGGSSRYSFGSSAGGGGGSGQINVYNLTVVPSMTYTMNIGCGGTYGYTLGNSTTGPAGVDWYSPQGSGLNGGDGSITSFTYNNVTIYANAGLQGGGGISNGAGGAGGGSGSNTLYSAGNIYSYNGNSGSIGGTGGGIAVKLGGNGGIPPYGSIINTNYIKLTSMQSSRLNNNVATTYYLLYGEGGKGGVGDNSNAGNNGCNGEYGAPGCVIIFFKY